MITDCIRTNSKNQDFKSLVKHLDAYLKITDGDEHDFYNQYNNIDVLKQVIVIYDAKKPIGCGAIKKFDDTSVEVKRMFVSEECRGKGVAQKILTELEIWANELGYKKCVLETGKRQIEAVQFYKKSGYKIIPNYGQYKGLENSICFEKTI
ncbi:MULTISPECIES: GNAT family N-acetyltransferase [Tenacibaculum]|uniref:GNAT family N-acetyltransferase n=1 Tax=Tenacibaculum todarodis TaxID=1850252 RepID=A0A1L3JL24_9FLAO|nr:MULTISPECIES: GNAT family N-acetyltransferase [Tenacibaculum]APG65784.1 GNAT family N-acetyltransferase [Tenacibaculum todarodis]MCH3883832.1 GNAT family N-acetyltransferase [Tenacibaculum aquimarinum]